jgi:N-acetylmuramoyl-L-alanine amidase
MFKIKILIKNLKNRVIITSSLAVFLIALFCSFGFDNPKKIKVIVIDAGHGGKDPGCNGVSAKEKDVSLAVALKLGKLIEDNFKDVKVIYTRKTDVFVELEDRAQIANKNKADLFISIHCNAAGKPVMIKDKKTGKLRPKTYTNKKGKKVVVETVNPVPFGSETYVMGLKNEEGKMKVAQRENSAILLEDNYEQKYQGFDPESEESYIIMSNYTSAYVLQSASLAVKIQEEYAKKAGRVDKGVHRQSIWVLWRTAMPSILTEIGYLTNPLEEQFLASEKGQEYVAVSIFKGFRKYKDELEGRKKDYDDEFERMAALENENLKAGNTGKPKAEDYAVEEENDKDSVKTVTTVSMTPKKGDDKSLSVKNNTVTTSTVVAKEEVKNETVAEIKKGDTDDSMKEEKDKDVSALDIVKNYNSSKGNDKDDAGDKEVKEKTDKSNDQVSFKVQFASSDTELNLKEEKFSAITEGGFYKVGSFYKYTSGNFKTSAEASKHQKKLKEAGFSDCFIVAFKNGQRIDLKEAKLLTEK